MLRKEMLVSAVAGAFMASLVAMPASAAVDPLVQDIDPPDTETQFFGGPDPGNSGWTGSDVQGGGNLDNANETTEGNWLSALLGLTVNSPGRPTFISRNDLPDPTPKSVTDFAGPTGWVFAVVNEDNRWWAFMNDGQGGLTTPLFQAGISHITWFTPLPAAAWLFLSGLVALFGWKRWTGRNGEAVAT